MADLLQVFLLSMTPIGELRLAIPMGIAVYHLPVMYVFLVSVIGNLVPAFILLFFLEEISVYLSKKSAFFQKMFSWWQNNVQKKHLEKVQKYGWAGVALFIAVPLPLTGAWTGALLATLLDLPIKKSLLAIFLGVTGAGIIVTTAVYFGINIEKYFGLQTLAGLLILCISVFFLLKFLLHKKIKI